MSEPDRSLIAEFNARRSEDAFAALVRQHVNLVFATALRQVGDAGAAEEITQNVFVALAQAAGKLGSHPTIAGWLHQTALNKSREWLRSELRRRKREQVAVNLDLARAEGDSVWSPLVPLLDEALLELREPDRQAVILHYLEGRNYQEVGSALGVGEDAARKRVDRCLGQLTHFFRRHGIATPALAVGAPLFTLSSHAAPAGLAASATTAGMAAAHSAASTSTLTLIKGALKIMAWTKTKTAIVVGASVLLAASTTTLVIQHQHHLATRNDVSRAAWVFSGYGEPKSAMMSFLWAIRQADGEQILAACSPGLQQTFQKHFEKQMQASGKSLGEFLAQDTPPRFNSTTGIRILEQKPVSEDRITLRVLALGEQKEHRITVKKIGEEWKVDGVMD
jgi:RNA polymerase sigma factor (sigma-70 family)